MPRRQLHAWWVTHSTVAVGGDTSEVHPAGVELDVDQHVQAAEEDGVAGEEVRRQQVRRLGTQEGPPGGAEPPTRGIEPGTREHPAERGGRDAQATTPPLSLMLAA